MRIRSKNYEAEKRMISTEEAAAYIGMGISKTKQLLNEIGAKRRFGRRVVYDKNVIDEWLDSLAADQEREE